MMRMTALKRKTLGVLETSRRALSVDEIWEILGKNGNRYNVERALKTMFDHGVVRRYKEPTETRWRWVYLHPDYANSVLNLGGDTLCKKDAVALQKAVDCETYLRTFDIPDMVSFYRRDPEMFYTLCEFILEIRDEETEL